MRFQIGAAFSVIPGLTRNLLCTPVAANPFIRRMGHIFWIRGKQKAVFRPNPCRQSTQNAYKADFVDSRHKKMAVTSTVTAIFILMLHQKFWKVVQLVLDSADFSIPESLSPGRLVKRSRPVICSM